MANITLDFLHNYHTGERRESDPANAYQYDEGHVLEAVLPEVVTSAEINYWIRGMENADAYAPGSITPNEDGSCTVLGNIPNKYFETNGELRIYIVVNDDNASITTYEGMLHICQRSMPDDYVDDDPENEATRVLVEAQEAAATATAAAQQAQAAASSAAAQASLANLYDATATYAVGDHCLYDGQLYVCTTEITTAESWTASHWTAVVVGDELTSLKEEISQLDGLSEDIKQALLQIASKVAFIDEDGQDYYDDLYDALYPPIGLESITAVYTQSGTVYDTDTLNSLKTDLVVTAHYDDYSSETVTAYALSGSLAVGISTITVSYGGKTTTFTVTVTENRMMPTTYTWLYDARQGELLSEQSYVTKETGGSGGTETLTDDQLVLNSQPPASGSSTNFLRFLLSDTSTTNAKLSGRVKFVKAITHIASNNAAGFRLQLSNGTNGAQAFFLDNSRKIDVAYFNGSTRSIYSTEFLFDEYHLIELELSDGTQKLSIDGTEVFSSSTLSSNYCTSNAILNQAPAAAQDPDGIITVIDWLSYYEVS